MAYQIQSGDTLTGIAQKNNTTVQDLMKLNPTITNPNLIQAGANLNLAPTPQANVNVPSSTNAADLGTAKAPVAPPTETAPSPDPFVASLEASTKQFQSAYDEANKAVAPVQAERAGLTDRLSQSLDRLTGRGAAQVQAEEKLGIPQNIKQLQDLNVQIAQKKGEYDKRIAGLAGQGRGITTGIVGLQTQREQRMAAVELGSLASVAQAVQGNIALAQQTADRTVELEFADRQQEVNNLKTLLELNSENMSTAEKKRAEQLSFTLQERQNAIDTEKENRKQVLSLTHDAAQQGADNATLTKMSQAKTPEEAIQFGGPALGAKFKADQLQQAFENSIKSQNLALDKIKAAKSGSGGGGSGAGPLSALTQAVIENPSLLNDMTPTNKGAVIAQLQANGYDTSNLGTKPLSDGAIKEISQTQGGLNALQDLKSIIQGNEDKLGPITGFARLNPWSESKKIQSDVDRVRQTVGKALEGGVLRKEDEEKYKKILATLNDTPSTAIYKIDALSNSLQRDIETYTSLQQSSGRSLDVKASLTKKGETQTSQADLRSKYKY